MKRVTIREVAKEAGVSITLVSFVMNAKRREDGSLDCPVNKDTAARVLEAARRLGYKRNAAAASLRSGRTNTIAVITTDISNKFFAGVSRCIEDAAYRNGYTVLFASSDEKADKLGALLDTLISHSIDGAIVAPVAGGEACVQAALDSNLPIVLLDRDIKELKGVGKVLLNDIEAGRMAAEYLFNKGYRKIEMLSYDLGISSLKEREGGYAQFMASNGLGGNMKIHYTTYEGLDNDIDSIVADMKARGTEALFLPTYSLSAATMMSLIRFGMKVPDDLAIVGFDDSNIYNVYQTSIPHIVQPLKDLGERSVDILLDMINGKKEQTMILNPIMIEE